VDTIKKLEENSQTALGPALASAVGLAHINGGLSQVILCTDGLANVGLGSFEEKQTDMQYFYKDLGFLALKNNESINIISIIGDECNLDQLIVLADVTGGQVQRVDPHNMS
jgi:hypothetical protein